MPIFDFKCPTCETTKKDVVLKVTATRELFPVCDCGKVMEKEWGTPAAHFRGKGFHATDYNAPTRGY